MNSVTIEHINSIIVGEEYTNNGRTTICTLYLKNGFNVIGTSGLVDVSKFDVALGEQYAREKAIEQVWAYEGYLLQQRWFEAGRVEPYKVPEWQTEGLLLSQAYGFFTDGYDITRASWAPGTSIRHTADLEVTPVIPITLFTNGQPVGGWHPQLEDITATDWQILHFPRPTEVLE